MRKRKRHKNVRASDADMDEFYRQHYPEILNMLYKRLGGREEADDLTQEAFARYTIAARENRIDNPRAYLFRVVHNLTIDHLRRTSAARRLFVQHAEPTDIGDKTPSAELRLVQQSEHDRLREAIAKMPPKCRQVFILRKLKGRSYAEIADEMGLSLAAVEKHVVRGLKICRLELIKNGVER